MVLKSSFPKNIVEAIIFYVSFSEGWCGHIISKQQHSNKYSCDLDMRQFIISILQRENLSDKEEILVKVKPRIEGVLLGMKYICTKYFLIGWLFYISVCDS